MNKHWLRKWLKGTPHVIIGGEDDPYLLRWFVIPRNRFFNIYLHKFLRSDDDRALHDHPWWFLSLILYGTYLEHRTDGIRVRKPLSVALRRPNMLHRVELLKPCPLERQRESPAWTLFFTGPKVRDWGFACPAGWRYWEEFVEIGCD